ncbi:hypothetical protein RHAB21_03841 [Pseudorhizobium halotolerans]|uniref:Transposase n=1 Tax=Pseudorhizobium halotolerans TaxID=1233081 RepID=A0ABM8PTM4_9HYPH|nr:hypothetical protein RHAB21_03841 [Pseudorhizobium halotolerans]
MFSSPIAFKKVERRHLFVECFPERVAEMPEPLGGY